MGTESSRAWSLLFFGCGICLMAMIGCSQSSPARDAGLGGSVGGQGASPSSASSGAGGSPSSGGSSGSSATGGSSQTGGSTTPGSAGSPGKAGNMAGGGATSDTGGNSATSGGGGSGGSSAAGAGAGGASAAGGSTGSSATGGAGTSSGGSRSGGTTGAAGSSGGAAGSPTGGASATGGTAGKGGTAMTGGTTGKGGTAATGGTTGAGGSTAASGAPVLVSTIDLKGASGCPGLRLGDINGDGRMEIVMGQPTDQASLGSYTPQIVVAVTAFDLKGKQLWQYGTPGQYHTASSDIPIQVYDMDGDGKAEVFANMSNTEMTVLDGTTGKVLRKLKLPQAGANDSIAFANLRGKAWPQDIIVKTRYSQFWAITGEDGTLLWNHKMLSADTGMADLGTGHYPLVYDWNGDGKDEVMGGYDFLDSTGKKLWSVTNLKLHADAIATGDLDGDPSNGYEIIVGGDVASAFEWKTGKVLWKDSNTTEC